MAKRTCSIEDCGNPYYARGWCRKHYERWQRLGDPLAGYRFRGVRNICEIDDCIRPVKGHRLCEMHYQRWRKYDSINLPTTEERFWAKVDKSGGPVACWPWIGKVGKFCFNGVLYHPHRLAWLLSGNELDGCVTHSCGQRDCMNPSHLQLLAEQRHGTSATYKSGCRCDDCKRSHAKACREQRNIRKGNLAQREHGTTATYHVGCRCEPCRKAGAAYRLARRKQRAAEISQHGIVQSYWAGCRCTLCRAAVAARGSRNRQARINDPTKVGRYRHQQSEQNHRRRSRTTNAYREPVALHDVGERDGWMCYICQKPIDPSVKWPHRLAPTLDHIVALANGGLHENANCAAVHHSCNSSKGNSDWKPELTQQNPTIE